MRVARKPALAAGRMVVSQAIAAPFPSPRAGAFLPALRALAALLALAAPLAAAEAEPATVPASVVGGGGGGGLWTGFMAVAGLAAALALYRELRRRDGD